jgi:YD repeat-containing protein
VGRITAYSYASNGLDLLTVRNTTGGANDLLAQYTYNSQHKPLTVSDASGRTTTFTYNSAGQIQTLTNARNETMTFTYSSSQGGYLGTIMGPVSGSTTSFTYDALGRVQSAAGPDGRSVSTDHDALDRPVTITYSDGSTEKLIYDALDLVARKDRMERWTYMTYNPLRQLTQVQDAAGRTTAFDWCTCGSLEQLTDPLGHVTNWWRDLQGRVIGKCLNDGSQTNYFYDSAGRLNSRVDALGQLTQYLYSPDNNLLQVSYPNALKPTATVSYTYDSKYNRLASMTDGFGSTVYTYNPIGATPPLGAGRLATVSGPFPNSSITYGYDELGRVVNRGINGVNEARTFDTLGRLSSVTNPLGAFQYTYQGVTGRLDNILLPSGQKTIFTNFDATQDFRMASITNQRSDTSVISSFTYNYNLDGTIKTWSQQADAQTPNVYSLSYDAANQLISAVLSQSGTTGALIHQYVYGYDLAGNRTSEQVDANITTVDFNDTNQQTATRKTAVTP